MFADDTICYAQGSTTEEVQSYLQKDVHKAGTWYNDNKLSLNIDKSECMLLGTRQRLHNNSNIEIILDGEVLQTYECTSYLRVDLINNVSWCQCIVKLCCKLTQKIGILRLSIRTFLSRP